ncbi:hypothetical protein BHE74_00036018 [Ensete ventricosum]|nr:hypothetical protein BHE74_00036018 [Ensete ventricosum]RZR99024.1 hypothetical protein BHM03_00028502 [Ensete ventricosum]
MFVLVLFILRWATSTKPNSWASQMLLAQEDQSIIFIGPSKQLKAYDEEADLIGSSTWVPRSLSNHGTRFFGRSNLLRAPQVSSAHGARPIPAVNFVGHDRRISRNQRPY